MEDLVRNFIDPLEGDRLEGMAEVSMGKPFDSWLGNCTIDDGRRKKEGREPRGHVPTQCAEESPSVRKEESSIYHGVLEQENKSILLFHHHGSDTNSKNSFTYRNALLSSTPKHEDIGDLVRLKTEDRSPQ
jgi:hypothetical protein